MEGVNMYINIVQYSPRSLDFRRSTLGLPATDAPTCAGKSSSLVAHTKLADLSPGRPGGGLRSTGGIRNLFNELYLRLKINLNNGTTFICRMMR